MLKGTCMNPKQFQSFLINSSLQKAISIIVGLIIILTSACANDNDISSTALSCEISRKEGRCTSIPTLDNGTLKIIQGRHFILNGQYNACFHEEAINIRGKYRVANYNNGMRFELLATKIQGLKSTKTVEFPSTVAVVTLNKTSLKGVISDIWATIRTPITVASRTEAEITCKSN
jgi:hypothetical protein